VRILLTCQQYRAKSDMVNPVLAGCLVGGWLARNNGPMAICGGCAAFAAFSYGIELYMHRETEDED
jgi:mitochondrial import inner membrane translocase subunit TIM22